MNLKGIDSAADKQSDVEGLRRQIESALGNVEEIVKNNAVISVATSAEDSKKEVRAAEDDDEIVVYVSIKINKNEKNHPAADHQNGFIPNGKPFIPVDHQNGHSLNFGNGEKEIKRVNMVENAEVTGKAIRPKARGRGANSLTAPSTPVHRGLKAAGQFLRSGSQEQYSGGQSKSLENLQDLEYGGYYRRIRRVRSRQSLKEKVWLPGKKESFNVLVNRKYVSQREENAKGKLQYYFPEPIPKAKCLHNSITNLKAD